MNLTSVLLCVFTVVIVVAVVAVVVVIGLIVIVVAVVAVLVVVVVVVVVVLVVLVVQDQSGKITLNEWFDLYEILLFKWREDRNQRSGLFCSLDQYPPSIIPFFVSKLQTHHSFLTVHSVQCAHSSQSHSWNRPHSEPRKTCSWV